MNAVFSYPTSAHNNQIACGGGFLLTGSTRYSGRHNTQGSDENQTFTHIAMIKKDLTVGRGNAALVAPVPHPLNDPIKEPAGMQVGFKRTTIIPVAHAITVSARN